MADEQQVSDTEVDDFADEQEIEEDVVYSVNSFGADFLVDGLISRLDSGDVYRPTFQRQFVWTVPQASRFIESILLGLPIPGIFLYREDVGRKHLIIDGLQRLTTIRSFAKGRILGGDRVFRLTKLKSRFDGRSIDDLEDADKRRFFDTTIHATIIQQLSPENDQSSAYYIFERLNTGGTPLQPQEIRAALYYGPFEQFIQDLNDDERWRKAFGPKHKRAKDLEMILRFFAFRYRLNDYKSPMKSFLNRFMQQNRKLNRYEPQQMKKDFFDALNFIVSAVKVRPFRPVSAFNAAAFDSVMVTVSQNIDKLTIDGGPVFAEKYKTLTDDSDFLRLITKSTADARSVEGRFAAAKRYLLT